MFDLNFLKKEKIYTKLKYSRTPQYDIVSGGVAALFAGFLGFLICEKFGLELLDSGDFYFFLCIPCLYVFLLNYYLNLQMVKTPFEVFLVINDFSYFIKIFSLTCRNENKVA